MLYDCLFFLTGVPPNRRFHDKNLFMAEVAPDMRALLLDALSNAKAPDALLHSEFFRAAEASRIVAVGMRLDASDTRSAMALGRHRVDAFIDAWAVTLSEIPQVSRLVIICAEGDQDGHLQLFSPTFWIETKDPDKSKGSDQWQRRQDEIFSAIFPMFDVATCEHAASGSPLARQIAFSLKMFRHGAESQVFPVDFLCKFAALEALVCGGERDEKRRKLTQRLPALFRSDPELNSDLINKLWDWRNATVHQSHGFHSEFAAEGKPVQVHVETIERLFTGTLVFAVSLLNRAQSVPELWTHVGNFILPPFATAKRPAGILRLPGVNWHSGTGLALGGARILFDRCLQSSNGSPPATPPAPPPEQA